MRKFLTYAALIILNTFTCAGISAQTSNTKNTPVIMGDSAGLDAFSRMRVSELEDLVTGTFQYDLQDVLFRPVLADGGTITHVPDQSSAQLAVTTTPGSTARFESRQYIRYLPARSQFIAMTGVMGAPVVDATRRIGYFDDEDGIFFQQTSTDAQWCVRSSTSGSPVDNCISQVDWNQDTLLSAISPSGHVLDLTKSQIWVIDFQWLGMGRVRVGFDLGGLIVYAHEFNNANSLDTPYMKTANLPVAWEMEGGGTAGTMLATCVNVSSEGGFNFDRGYPFNGSNGLNFATVTTSETLVFAVRMANNLPASGGTIPNEATALVQSISLFSPTSDTFVWRVVYGGTLTGGSWTPTVAGPTRSGVEFSVDAVYTADTGITVLNDYLSGSNQVRGLVARSIAARVPLVRNGFGTIDGEDWGNFIVLATVTGGTGDLGTTLGWVELR